MATLHLSTPHSSRHLSTSCMSALRLPNTSSAPPLHLSKQPEQLFCIPREFYLFNIRPMTIT